MRKFRLIPLLATVIAFLTLVAISIESTVQAQGENLLTNPGFEGNYSTFTPQFDYQRAACDVGVCTTAQMPAGWFPWWVPQTEDNEPWENRMPEYKPVCPFAPCPFPERVKSGTQALQYFTFHSTHLAGVWQTVTVPANANVKFAIWGQAWSSASDKVPSDFPTVVNMRIGIDPTGGNNPFSPNIVWSGTANPYDTYRRFEVEATAQGDKVTVFTWSQPQEARKHNDIYWDEASLVVGGQGAPAPAAATSGGGNAPAASQPVPVLGPTSTPNAEGVILTEVQPGDTMWSIAARSGLTLDEFLDLNAGLTRDQFIKVGEQYITGHGEPGGAAVADEAPAADESAAADADPEADTAAAEEAIDDTAEEAVDTTIADVPDDAAVANTAEETETQPAVAKAEAPAETGGTICLRAFHDSNQDGIFNDGEALKESVAFTIANGQSVVSNYVTDGSSEPYCIEGLAAGNYRVSRSFGKDEVATNAGDWAVSLADGSVMSLDFGSLIDPTASQAAEVAPATDNLSNELSVSNLPAQEASSGAGWGSWAVIVIVALAAVLLMGVVVVVLSARRTA